jgi:hypothetical protein
MGFGSLCAGGELGVKRTTPSLLGSGCKEEGQMLGCGGPHGPEARAPCYAAMSPP